MNERDLQLLLNTIDFPRRYWELCDRFPLQPTGKSNLGRKEDILAAYAEVGIKPVYYRDGAFEFEEERICDFTWSGVFVKQRNGGVELMFNGESNGTILGSNFAVMAYESKRLADPTFSRDPFQGPPPYPRPDHNGDPVALKEIVKQHVALVRMIKAILKASAEVAERETVARACFNPVAAAAAHKAFVARKKGEPHDGN